MMPEAGKPPVEMPVHGIAIIRFMGIIGAVISALISVAIPALYYTFAIKAERQDLRIETLYTSKAIQQIIFARPELWEFETLRLLDIASKRTVDDDEDERIIYDASGKIIVETNYKAPAPIISSTAPIFVSDYQAGTVKAKRSIRDVMRGTVFAGILGGVFGLCVYFLFRAYPLRMLNEAWIGLASEKEKTETTLSSIGDGVITVDREGRIIYMNPVAEMCTGWKCDEAFGRSHQDCYVTRRESERLEGEVHTHCALVARNGEQKTIEEVWSPIIDKNSVEKGHVIVFRDITKQKLTEEERRKSEERYRALFSRAGDGIFIMSPDGNLIDVNESFARMHGYSREELLQLNIRNLDTPKTSKMIPERLARLMAGETLTFEVEHYHKDGHTFPLEASASLISFGGESYIQGFHRDITERKQTEAEKEKLQDQLQQAMKMEAVGRLAGGVAHDFNNLLTVVTGYCELLLQKVGKESPLYEEVEEIKRAGDRAASLTQQLLAFSRKQIIAPKVVYLDRLVAEVHSILTRLIGEDIEIRFITGKSLGPVKIDPGQFQQILMNLAVNSRDAMPEGGKIVIETANVDLDEDYCALHPYIRPGRFVMLSVSDNGKGMSEEVKSHIFEPFFTTKERGSGTGLGLATTYGAVKQAGGSIQVYSEVGKGTTIKIYLPRVEEEVAKPVKDDRPLDFPGGTETVLLVEDEDIVRNLCAQILRDLGYKVMQARNAADAIALAQGYGERIDLLLTDVVMPGMNGAELATQLGPHHPEMKVLFTSGYTNDAIVHYGVLDEGVSFIGKPYSPKEMARKVREVLDKAG